MAGMLQQAMGAPEEQEQPPVGQEQPPIGKEELPPEGDVQGEEEPEATDEDINAVITGMMEFLYEKGAAEDAIEIISGSGNVAKGLADATYSAISMFDEQSGGNAPVDALIAGAADALAKLAEDYEKKTKQDIPDSEVARAAQIMLIRFAQESGIDASELEGILEGVDLNAAKEQLGAAVQGEGQPDQPQGQPPAEPTEEVV